MNNALTQIQQQIDMLLEQKSQVLVAIDGCCGAGKSTLAAALARQYACNVFHMDDFFLRPEQRTTERFAQTGGNVDYERFREEILVPLAAGRSFSYRPFDCSTFRLTAPVETVPKKLNIIEGTYSHHPYFGDVYDLKIFLTITPELQKARILRRPAFLHQRFFETWIPMEQQYFSGFQIRENSHLTVSFSDQT